MIMKARRCLETVLQANGCESVLTFIQPELICNTGKEPPHSKSHSASFEMSQQALKRVGQLQNGLEVVNEAITYIHILYLIARKFSNGVNSHIFQHVQSVCKLKLTQIFFAGVRA